jgi:hypothetical protein
MSALPLSSDVGAHRGSPRADNSVPRSANFRAALKQRLDAYDLAIVEFDTLAVS